MITFACLGHWYVQILFGAPSAGIMLVMGRDSLKKKRRKRAAAVGTNPPQAPPAA
jgi:hypothetical protein